MTRTLRYFAFFLASLVLSGPTLADDYSDTTALFRKTAKAASISQTATDTPCSRPWAKAVSWWGAPSGAARSIAAAR